MPSDRELKDQIREKVNLVELVSRNVQLRKSGGTEWVGLCPFHAERSPSFNVIPMKNFYHCFGCGEHGDAFDWLMKQEGLTFPEALEQLAKIAGVDLPKYELANRKEDAHELRLLAIMGAAQDFFAGQRMSEEDAVAYLQMRGLSTAFIEQVGLGVAPNTWEMLTKHLLGQGFKAFDLEAAGVCAQGQRGTIDFMRNRITIPIKDHRGRLVAFGGRLLDGEGPKYLNSRESGLFKKSEVLFGLDVAKAHMADGALVVEGYFDVLMLQFLGIKNPVAPLGTALTFDHLNRLKKYTTKFTLCFDGDEAGHRAMEKTLGLALPLGFDVRLLELPTGEDPDSWAATVGADGFRHLMGLAPDWTAFKINRAVSKRDMRRTPDRMAALQELAPMLSYVAQEARDGFVATLAHQLEVPAYEVLRAAGAAPPQEAPKKAEAAPVAIKVDRAIKALLVAMLQGDNAAVVVVQTPRDWWINLSGACVLEEILDSKPGETGPAAQEAMREVEAMVACGHTVNLDRLLSALELAYVEASLRRVRMDIEDPKTAPDVRELLQAEEVRLRDRNAALSRRQSTT
jgi:DNA primase